MLPEPLPRPGMRPGAGTVRRGRPSRARGHGSAGAGRRLRGAALALLAGVCSAAGAADPRDVLLRMNAALAQLDYEGVVTYVRDDQLSVLRVVHVVVDGEQRERLVHLNGPRREIVRRGDRVICVLSPGDDILALARTIPAGPFVRAFTRGWDRIPEHYRLSEGRMERIAGRPARELLIRPLDENRYGHRLWIDDATGLLLRSEVLDPTGFHRRLEVFQFTELRVGPGIDPAEAEPDASDDVVQQELMLADAGPAEGMATSPWSVAWRPDGFTLAATDRRTKPRSMRKVSTLLFSDGVASFSVFVEPVSDPRRLRERSTRRGGTVAVMKVLGADGPGTLVTVVGEIPLRTAERVARSVRPVAP
jgi:sigma-E factor negative regulatory protein RseB